MSGSSRLIGGATLDPNLFWPPSGQDCEATLNAGGNVPTMAPQAFLDECAGCHGADGRGRGLYPNIVGPRDLSAFFTTVRGGKQGAQAEMPAFKNQWVGDNDLRRIYGFLTGSAVQETRNCAPSPTMNAADIAQANTAGLAAWRKFDGKTDPNGIISNVACAQCHAPDPLDLAYYGFTDGDIFRRGTLHLSASDVSSIVDMVHGMRTQYKIGRRDPLVVRPFQPSGALIAGNSIAARDAAFMQQLVDMKLLVATRPIASAADANQAMSEVWHIDRHMMPIPIPFDRYVEDQFFNPPGYVSNCADDIDACDDHGSIADWIPVAPHIPQSFTQFFAAEDQYLANPNSKNLAYVQYLAGTASMTGSYTGNSYGTDGLDQGKYKAIMLAHHCVRLEVLGLQGCYDSGLTPFPNMADIWAVGSTANLFGTGYGNQTACDTQWTSCAQPPANLPLWPAHLLADITPGATLSSNFSRIRAPWMDLWWTHFDPTLLVTGDPTAQKDEYFTRSMYWVNNNDWKFANTPPSQLHPAYAAYNAYQVMMHNIATLMTPQLASCKLYPATDFTCTAIDLRSGYYPDLVNFAEQNTVASPESSNNINYQILYQPSSGAYRAQYQLLVTNMYRMFFWGLIGQLQQSNWMCNQTLQNLRIVRAQKFFSQAETQAGNAQADAQMFATLQALMAKSTASCPPLTTSP